ncbi:alpha/beta hydrolase [Streptomyces sp. G3]|uniref:alpha/beta hydrolase n=1 Tax=Streptomyces sp. G3 TaxID=690144 RepID=UPI0020305467|nr:alpha/beta hydrolase [Streptomyces sp. G3]MCM1936616.1 alpha/beta hydrolase [Streptomyces sp. G3]
MAKVVMCHGIGYTYKHRDDMHSDWYKALRTGMIDTGFEPVKETGVAAVYYGNCFRSAGSKGAVGLDEFAAIPNYGPVDLSADLELELLRAFAENTDSGQTGTKGAVQGLLRRLERSKLLGDVPTKAIIWMIKQVHRYLTEDALRDAVLSRWDGVVTPDTRVVVAHSLGSVVAYDALSTHQEWEIDTLITLGSPLGLGAVSSRLRPPLVPGQEAKWPGVRRWINIAAVEDPVALVKELAPLFGKEVEDMLVRNGRFAMHSVLRYLTTAEAAKGIADGLGSA